MPQDLEATGTALLEIGTEELPPRFFYEALPQLESLAAKQLANHRLDCEKPNVYGSPRRLVLEIPALRAHQADYKKEVRGPAKAGAYDEKGNPSPALQGFLKGQKVPLDSVQIKEFGGKPYVVVQEEKKGKPAPEILSIIFPEIISGLTFPKAMRWNGNFLFGRPIRWILALFDKSAVQFELAGLVSGSTTRGHRAYAKEPIEIARPEVYQEQLRKVYVIPHHHHRGELIRSQVVALAISKSGNIFRIDSILDEVTMLVEYPISFLGSFDKRFLSLPEDVLVTVMQHHQRYFPVVDKQGKLLPHFVGVRNGTEEGLDDVRFGNEQVIRARFKDAEYFFSVDKKSKLLDRLKALETLVFQKNLGTVLQKVDRLKKLAPILVAESKTDISKQDLDLVINLCKCDLATQMVFEFPELQGSMGKEYARLEGYSESVSQAILDHYLPRFQGDEFPKTPIGTIVGIADRMDTLVGCFGLNLKPTGSSDPLGLRRGAATLLQILAEKGLELNLNRIAKETLGEYERTGLLKDIQKEALLLEVALFIVERADALWKSAGIRYDLVRAFEKLILEKPTGSFKRAQFLETLRASEKEKFAAFVTAWVRVFNILKSKEAQEIIKEGVPTDFPRSKNMKEKEEKQLLELAQELSPKVAKALEQGDSQLAWKTLSQFEAPIHAYFDKVLVMAPEKELRKTRLNFLWNLRQLMLESFGDLTQIVLD